MCGKFRLRQIDHSDRVMSECERTYFEGSGLTNFVSMFVTRTTGAFNGGRGAHLLSASNRSPRAWTATAAQPRVSVHLQHLSMLSERLVPARDHRHGAREEGGL